MNYSQQDQDAVERIHNCVDAAASMMLEYFDNPEEADFPYVWKEYPFQGKKVYLQFSTENSNLEAEANRLLGVNEEDLLIEEEDDEDALTRAETSEELSPPREEDSEESDDEEEDEETDEKDKGPKMFGGGKKPKKLH
ncbi:hypothetical protein D3C72_1659000 [compost metagenome]